MQAGKLTFPVRIGAALTEKASELFAQPPAIEELNVLASKNSPLKSGRETS